MTQPPDANLPPDSSKNAITALPIRHDLPCIKCKYNLRGLRDGDLCPECASPVAHTLDEVQTTVLCPSCMAQNHHALAKCANCGSALQGVAATSDYFRPTGGAVSLPSRRRFTSVVLIFMFLAPFMFYCAKATIEIFIEAFQREVGIALFILALVCLVGAIVSGTILFAVLRAYITRPSEKKEEEETSPDDATEAEEA